MKVILNPNKEIVTKIERIEENRCMCEEFRNQIKDPEYEGYCHCMLYLKTKEDEHGNK